ncbi:MAG: hypothetical protein WEB04_04145 [Dehalococcoidia bacterium]
MATQTGPADRFVDALTESSTAVMDRVKTASERAHRVTTALVSEAERIQQDALDLTRKVIQDPADIVGNTGLAYQKAIVAQERVFEFARNALEEAVTANRETRTTVERVLRANFDASRPAVEQVREFVTRTGEALRPSFLRTQEAVSAPAPRARKTAAEEAA